MFDEDYEMLKEEFMDSQDLAFYIYDKIETMNRVEKIEFFNELYSLMDNEGRIVMANAANITI
jgi:hypothetical protein